MSSIFVSNQPSQLSMVGAVIKLGGTIVIQVWRLGNNFSCIQPLSIFIVLPTLEYLWSSNISVSNPSDVWCGLVVIDCIGNIPQGWLKYWCFAQQLMGFLQTLHFRHHLGRQDVWQESGDKECRHVWRDAAGLDQWNIICVICWPAHEFWSFNRRSLPLLSECNNRMQLTVQRKPWRSTMWRRTLPPSSRRRWTKSRRFVF